MSLFESAPWERAPWEDDDWPSPTVNGVRLPRGLTLELHTEIVRLIGEGSERPWDEVATDIYRAIKAAAPKPFVYHKSATSWDKRNGLRNYEWPDEVKK